MPRKLPLLTTNAVFLGTSSYNVKYDVLGHSRTHPTFEQFLMVPLSAQLEYGAPEQVELYSHLGDHGEVNNGGHLMGCKDPLRVVLQGNKEPINRLFC